MTDWQARYTSHDTPWDKGAAAPPLLELLQDLTFAGEVLVPGCGFGHDVRAIAQSAPLVIGLDLAEAAVAGARKFPRTGNEEYVVGNLFALPTEWTGRFDIVFEHTCFCAIDPTDRVHYVDSVVQALKPGGRLVGIFYLNPDHDDGPPFRVSRKELADLFEGHFTLLQAVVPKTAFPGREGREELRIYQRKP